MIKNVTLIALMICFSTFSYSQENEKRFLMEYGIGLDHGFFSTQTRNEELNYFSSSYSNGGCLTLLSKNRFGFVNWFLSADAGLGLTYQDQSLIFSNELDAIIDFDVKHSFFFYQFNFGLGKYFELSQNSKLSLEFSANIYGFFKSGRPSNEITGNFESEYVSIEDFWLGTSSVENYQYTISYASHGDISPSIKLGYLIDVKNKKLEFGTSYSYRRMEYENFIIIESSNYSAIANSRSRSNSWSIFLNLFFN